MDKLKISLIAAIGKNRELGKDNKLLWHIPEDLKRFKDLTNGHPIIMGRKTFESIGRVLPGRANIIVTRNKQHVTGQKEYAGTFVVESLEEGIHEAENWLKTNGHGPKTNEHEVFIIGGGQIFEQAIGIADKLYLTIVDRDFEADTYFPEYSHIFKKEVYREKKEFNGYRYVFVDLEK